MSNIIKIVFFIGIAFGLYGCDLIFGGKSMLYKKIKNIDLNKAIKIENLIDGQWDKICILPPYHDPHGDLKDKLDITIDEAHWHFVLSERENLKAISFKRNKNLDVQQINFSQDQIDNFSKVDFSPANCLEFNQAAIFKFQRSDAIKPENIRTYITLGAIKR